MPIGTNIQAVNQGLNPVSKIYKGSTVVWNRDALEFDFTAGLPSNLTLTRTSDQWIRDANGYQTKIASDVYGIHHTYTGTALGYLAEGTFTALTGYTNQFQSWTPDAGCAATDGAVTGPDNTTSAAKLAEVAVNTNKVFISTDTYERYSGQSVILSIFAKSDERQFIRLATPSTVNQVYDLTTPAVGLTTSGSPVNPMLKSEANGFYRVSFSKSFTGTGSADARVQMRQSDSSLAYTGTAGYGIRVWGFNVGEGTYPTSYVEVVGSGTGTREASRLAGNFPFRIPSSIHIAGRSATGIGSTDQHFCCITEASYGRKIQVYRQASDRHLIVDWGASSTDLGVLADSTDFDETVLINPGGMVHLIEVGTDYTGIAKHWDGTVARIDID